MLRKIDPSSDTLAVGGSCDIVGGIYTFKVGFYDTNENLIQLSDRYTLISQYDPNSDNYTPYLYDATPDAELKIPEQAVYYELIELEKKGDWQIGSGDYVNQNPPF